MHTGELPLHPSLSQQGKTAKSLPQLTSASLISIGKLCDDNCIVTFDKSQMCVYKHNQEIMRGIHNPCDGLWNIPIPTQHIHTHTLTQQEKFCPQQDTQHSNIYSAIHLVASHSSLSVIIRKDTTNLDLAQYLHAASFSPVKSTWARAIDNNHFSSWPGLTLQLIWKHLPVSLAMVQGHLKQEQQGL